MADNGPVQGRGRKGEFMAPENYAPKAVNNADATALAKKKARPAEAKQWTPSDSFNAAYAPGDFKARSSSKDALDSIDRHDWSGGGSDPFASLKAAQAEPTNHVHSSIPKSWGSAPEGIFHDRRRAGLGPSSAESGKYAPTKAPPPRPKVLPPSEVPRASEPTPATPHVQAAQAQAKPAPTRGDVLGARYGSMRQYNEARAARAKDKKERASQGVRGALTNAVFPVKPIGRHSQKVADYRKKRGA